MFAVIKMELHVSGKTVYGPVLKTTQPLRMRKITPARNVAVNLLPWMIFLGDHDIQLTGSNFGNLTASRAIFSHIFTAHAQESPLMNFRLKF